MLLVCWNETLRFLPPPLRDFENVWAHYINLWVVLSEQKIGGFFTGLSTGLVDLLIILKYIRNVP